MKIVLTLRVLSYVRIITRNESLKLTSVSILYALQDILALTIFIFLIFLIFGIFFLNLFKGKFYSCHFINDEYKKLFIEKKLRTKNDCYNFGGNWQNSKLNFDNIFESIISLVFIALGGGYIEIMENAADSKQIDYEPKSIN